MLCVAAAMGVGACAAERPPGQRAAKRIVTLLPAGTDIVRALGARNLLVARTLEDSAADIRPLPAVGRVLEPSIEGIVAVEPDLVIAWADARTLSTQLAGAGIAVYAASFDRIVDIPAHIKGIGRLLGQPQRGDSLANHITQQLDNLRREHAHQRRPSVLYLLQVEPLWTAGPGSFVDDLVEVAGGRNLFDDLAEPWSLVALEAIAQRQPDVIIVAQAGAPAHTREWLQNPVWQRLPAVRNGRVHFVDADRFNRPGTNVIESARELARLLHPASSDV